MPRRLAIWVIVLLGAACEDQADHAHELFEQSMLQQLENGSASERAQAATALGDLPPSKRTIDRLVRALDDSSVYVRIAAAGTLGKVGAAPRELARGVLADAVGHTDPEVRSTAIRAIATDTWRDSTVAALLIPLLEDASFGVRVTAAQALGGLGELARPAIPALERALRDSSDYVRDEARNALRAIRAAGSG